MYLRRTRWLQSSRKFWMMKKSDGLRRCTLKSISLASPVLLYRYYTHNPTCVLLLAYCSLLNMVWLYAFLHLAILVWISFYMSLSVSEAESRFGQIDSCQSATRSSCCSLHLEWTCRFPAQVRWWHDLWKYNHKDADDGKCYSKNYDHVSKKMFK